MNVTIVLPTYNEAENIKDFLNSVYTEIEKIQGFNINTLIVDDNSPDKTADIVKELQKNNSKIYLLNNNNLTLFLAFKSLLNFQNSSALDKCLRIFGIRSRLQQL